MKIMSHHSSAAERNGTPHTVNSTNNQTISDAIKRRAQSVINDKSIDIGSRFFIRYAMEINDPWLPELVRRVDAGETIVDNPNLPPTNEEKIETLAKMICGAGNEPAAALLVLMATLENATDARALTNMAKLFAFTRCIELNCYGMVDTQIAALESELLVN
jgi:hypothetical protein